MAYPYYANYAPQYFPQYPQYTPQNYTSQNYNPSPIANQSGIIWVSGITEASNYPVALALTVNGEPRLTSRAIYTPAAVEEFGNLTSTAIIKVPRGCCFSLSVEYVPASEDPAVTPTPIVTVQNSNLVVDRIA